MTKSLLTMALLALVAVPMTHASTEVWNGEFTITIKGSGSAKGPGPSVGKWGIDRAARGSFVLDQTFTGAGIAGTPDSKNATRYESWISTTKAPIEMRIRDLVTVRGPLFAANQIRFDTFKWNCPYPQRDEAWQSGKVGSGILQFDYQSGTYTFETPRFFATCRAYFSREFVEGPKSWTSNPPILRDKDELEFEIIHGLIQPKDWFRVTGPYAKGQTEIQVERGFDFGPPLGASILNQKVRAVLKMTFKKSR